MTIPGVQHTWCVSLIKQLCIVWCKAWPLDTTKNRSSARKNVVSLMQRLYARLQPVAYTHVQLSVP